jgi:diguanylate cyclase (GGDEF)-like protein
MFEKSYEILAIDDAKDGLMLLAFDLNQAGCHVTTANSGESALQMLKSKEFDLIILDMHMPGLSGLATLEKLKNDAAMQDVPVIMLSASDLEDEVVAALELGAADYVVKPYIRKVLLARMNTALKLREKTKELARLATTDFLTEINNRASFYHLADKAISHALRKEAEIIIAMFDIDFFKDVNDNFGHDVGDKVLKVFAKTMKDSFRTYDIIGRFGGEEFVVCLPSTNINEAMDACERFRIEIEELEIPNSIPPNDNGFLKTTFSAGLASSSHVSLDIDKLLKQADIALYHAKSTGRNKVVNVADIVNGSTEVQPENLTQSTAFNEDDLNSMFDDTVINEEFTLSEELSIDGIETKVGLDNVLGDKSLYEEILKMFYQDHIEDDKKLLQAIELQDEKMIKHIAHTLKGVACSIGAMSLFNITKKLDEEISTGNTDLKALAEEVAIQLKAVINSVYCALIK